MKKRRITPSSVGLLERGSVAIVLGRYIIAAKPSGIQCCCQVSLFESINDLGIECARDYRLHIVLSVESDKEAEGRT